MEKTNQKSTVNIHSNFTLYPSDYIIYTPFSNKISPFTWKEYSYSCHRGINKLRKFHKHQEPVNRSFEQYLKHHRNKIPITTQKDPKHGRFLIDHVQERILGFIIFPNVLGNILVRNGFPLDASPLDCKGNTASSRESNKRQVIKRI